jgi:hypothetical protein
MEYFDVIADDKKFDSRWFLGEPLTNSLEEIDSRLFRYGVEYSGQLPCRVPISQEGTSVAFNLAAFDMPVINEEARDALLSVTSYGYELFPVEVDSLDERFWILNVTSRVPCVDESRCQFLKWGPEDSRPDRIGSYRSISNLKINPRQVNGHIFRIKGWEVVMIVSGEVVRALTGVPNLGIVFVNVT